MTAPESTPDASTERANAIARAALNDLDALRREAESATDEDRENEASLNGRCAINIILEAAAAIGELRGEQAAATAKRLSLPPGHYPDSLENPCEGAEAPPLSAAYGGTPAAIQRGDGQTETSVLHQLSAAFSKRGYSPARAAAKIPEELNGIRCILLEIGQMLTTPPADELRAKPNETSGATPEDQSLKVREIRQRYADSSKHLVNWWDSDIKVLLLEIQRLELAAVRAAGDHIGDANEMVADVRKSAGAEGVSESFKQADKALLGIKLRCYEAQSDGSKMTAYELAATILDENESAFDAMTDRINRKLLTAERTAGAVAKSTPGVDGAMDEAIEALEFYEKCAGNIRKINDEGCLALRRLEFDDGQRASNALARLRAKPADADGASGGKEGV